MDNDDAVDAVDLEETLLASATEPEPEPEPEAVQPEATLPVISNFDVVAGENGKPQKRGLLMQTICQDVYEHSGDWPKRIGNHLFVWGSDDKPRWFDTPAQLFAWLDAISKVEWAHGHDMITPERFFAHLQETAESYSALETFPHFPELPDTFYMHSELPATSGEYLEQFVSFFTPATPVDCELIRAFISSLVWGGEPGSRPAWLFTAPSDDPEGGRGVGKSKLIELCSELVGGMIEISTNEDIIAVKKRLLSPAAGTIRVARLDNIKSLRFSWADLEGLITAPVISGHRMYKGEGRRPNTITWALTLNGASLSKDMAKRVFVVTLARPAYDPNWESSVRSYINEYRLQIINDIGLLLQS